MPPVLNVGLNLSQIWDWVKIIGGVIIGALLLWFIGWVIVSTLQWYGQQDKKAQAKGYRNYKHYKQAVINPRREADKAERDAELAASRDLSPEQKRLLAAESAVWQSGSTGPLDGVANEAYIQQAELQLQALASNGLRRDFAFTPDATVNERHHDVQFDHDGKVTRGLTAVFGRSDFTWRQQTSGEVVASKSLPFSELQFALASGRQESSDKRFSCVNCGAPIPSSNDDVLHCPSCGAISYRSDYENLLTQINVFALNRFQQVETKTSSAILRNAERVGLALSLLVFLGYCSYPLYADKLYEARAGEAFDNWLAELLEKLWPSGGGMGLVFVGLIVLALAAPYVVGKIRAARARSQDAQIEAERDLRAGRAALQEQDPHFSVDLAKAEMLMMVKTLLLTGRDPSADSWAVYIDPANRAQLQQEFAGQKPVVDVIVNQAVLDQTDANDGGLSRISFYLNYDVLVAEGRSFTLRNRESTVELVRNAYGRTLVLDGDEPGRCPNCRAPVQLLTQDSCTACQTGLHRNETYWRISAITKASGAPAHAPTGQRERFSDVAPIFKDALRFGR